MAGFEVTIEGHTDNLDHRIAQHNDGTLVGYTSQRRPVELLYFQSFDKLSG